MPKIATCCYCGARAALILDRVRHELACSNCGAPLREMKALRTGHEAAPHHDLIPPSRLRGTAGPDRRAKPQKPKKRKKKKSLGRKIFSEIWDVIEDIVD